MLQHEKGRIHKFCINVIQYKNKKIKFTFLAWEARKERKNR